MTLKSSSMSIRYSNHAILWIVPKVSSASECCVDSSHNPTMHHSHHSPLTDHSCLKTKNTRMFGASPKPLILECHQATTSDYQISKSKHKHVNKTNDLHANGDPDVVSAVVSCGNFTQNHSWESQSALSFTLLVSTSANKLEIKKDRHIGLFVR